MRYKWLAKQLIATGCAAAMAASLSVVPLAQAQPSSSSNVTAAACRAAGMAPEILGIDGIEESGQFISPASIGLQSDLTSTNLAYWAYPKYLLMGSDYNTNANRFMYDIEENDPSILYNGSRSGNGHGPNQALSASDSTDNAVLSQHPDIIVGTGTSSTDDSAEDAIYANILTGYSPKGVTYSFSNNDNMCDVMYDLADKADAIVSASNGAKTLRYGTASSIALAYEKYIKGTKGVILQALNNNTTGKRSIALVTAANSDGTYTILKTDEDNSDGTASQNRYLEACANVTDNIANNLDSTSSTTTTVTKAQLQTANLVMVGGQSGSLKSVYDALIADGFSNVYYTKMADSDVSLINVLSDVNPITNTTNNNSAAAGYGTVMNSVENAQNIGRILGILYPDVVDQASFIAYYFQTFYHIAVPASQNADGNTAYDYANLKTVLVNALNGRVPKGSTVTTTSDSGTTYTITTSYDWSTNDFSNYSKTAAGTVIDGGCSYITNLISASGTSAVPEELIPAGEDEDGNPAFVLPDTDEN